MYDQNVVHTPSTITGSSYKQEVEEIRATEQKQDLKQQLTENGFVGRIEMTKSYNRLNGRGTIPDCERGHIGRYNDSQIAHFIEFTLVTYNNRSSIWKEEIELETGEEIIIPNTIRNLIPTRIIQQYPAFCHETQSKKGGDDDQNKNADPNNDFQPLDETSLYEILKACSSSTRKSLQGLDYYAADGSSAFHSLAKIYEELAAYDGTKQFVLENLDGESVFIFLDWAMKWLAMKYREGQKDFFAKRGCPWHLAYVIRVKSSNSISTTPKTKEFEHKTYAHIFDSCVQNGQAVTSILEYIFSRLKASNLEIKYVYLCADNAGCYHGVETLLAVKKLYANTGILIRRFDFFDPHGGKGPCDRMAAVVKCDVRCSVNEKNDCTNSRGFVTAARLTRNLSILASKISPSSSSSIKVKWTGVLLYNNIEYNLKSNVG
ncbi:unnamed protein product [Didymodactylos carnosus]|uniref:Uncharacterized protein n=1 Tax=Didymodactylos carnosus TaxID=1234261 RepID=A0A814HWA7_9BILA|nr:unnamed protein product [Didymodactylos carnosus]CAF3785472.1 unnamed protein product [Didymodactylos carnosus]